jgi:RNA polymerase sigma-70 factor (ECF subfamily)
MIEIENTFNELYEANADAIFRLCLFKTSNREVALDLSQDIFTKTWDYLQKGNQVDNLRAFLFTVARNRIKDYYKKRKTPTLSNAGIENEADLVISELDSSSLAEVNDLLKLLGTLPDDHAELLQLRYVEGLSIEEMAIIFQTRPNTLAVKIHRIVHRLREQI